MPIDFEAARERWERQNARISELLLGEPRPLRFALEHGATILVSRDMLKPGEWRITRFDALGQPTGHIACPTYERAVREARKLGGDVLEGMTLL
jgi:hypothetical protein